MDRNVVDDERLHHRLTDAVRDLACRVVARVVDAQHDELIAAEARNGVARPNNAAKTLGDRLKESVTERVTEAVVDHFEAVEVDEQDGRRPLAAVVAAEPADAVFEQRSIGQSGEGVVQRLTFEVRLELLALADVVSDG